jgi:hypothetical protein
VFLDAGTGCRGAVVQALRYGLGKEVAVYSILYVIGAVVVIVVVLRLLGLF